MRPTILHIITGLGCGGAEASLRRLVLASQAAGNSNHVVISLLDDGIHGAALREGGVEVHCLRLHTVWALPLALLRLIKIMRGVRPDCVMTWLYHADLIGTLAAIISGIGLDRLVWNLRCSNLEFHRYAWTTRAVVLLLKRLSPLPRAIAANSLAGIRAHKMLGYQSRNWIHLPNGVDMDAWYPCASTRSQVRRELGVSEGAPVIGMVARFDPQKDHATFLSAAKAVLERHSSARFVLIGHGTERFANNYDWLIPLGQRDDVPRLLRAVDAVVLSSAYGEGTPNAVLEAMATAVPCIVTCVGDAPAVVGDAGIVIPRRHPEALAVAITSLLDEASPSRRARGYRAREFVRLNFDIADTLNSYGHVWSDVAGLSVASPREVIGVGRSQVAQPANQLFNQNPERGALPADATFDNEKWQSRTAA